MNREIYVMYEINIKRLALVLADDRELVFPEALSNGRANYVIFESLVRHFTGLTKTKGSDHRDGSGKNYEQKAYEDPQLFPDSEDLFRFSASSTFGANNQGPKIKTLLEEGNYDAALEICKKTGYDKNDYYVFTNSASYKSSIPFRYFIVPKGDLLEFLDSEDPRMVSRSHLLGLIKSKVVLV
ncbi:MAG: hypothetical protein ACOVMF_00150 [Aquiluna sp.]|jgi:hypothetical protein